MAAALADCFAALKDSYDVQIEVWPLEQGKGIDDLLRSGGKPTLLSGEAAGDYLDKLLTSDEEETPSLTEEKKLQIAVAEQTKPTQSNIKGPEKFPYGVGEPVPFPLDFFPEPLQKVVREISTAVNCPPDLAACAMVTAGATAIGRSRQLEPKEGWKICPRIYVGIVCDPGSGKTPALTKVMEPLWRKNDEWNEEFKLDQEVYEIEKMTYEVRKKEFMKHVEKHTKQEQTCRRREEPQEENDTDAFDNEG